MTKKEDKKLGIEDIDIVSFETGELEEVSGGSTSIKCHTSNCPPGN